MRKTRWLSFGIRAITLTLVMASAGQAVGADIAIIELHYRLAEEVAAVIRPLLEPGEAVTADRNSLILRANASKLSEINALVQELDRPRHRLLITVAQGSGLSAEALNARFGMTTSANSSQISPSGHIYQTESQNKGTDIQKVQTLDGQAATISIGSQIPIPVGGAAMTPYGNAAIVNPGIQYQEISTGFYVLPRVKGDRVQIEVSPQSENLSGLGGGVINTRSVQSTLESKLGEWVEIGGESEFSQTSETGMISHHYETRSSSTKFFMKVDDLDVSR